MGVASPQPLSQRVDTLSNNEHVGGAGGGKEGNACFVPAFGGRRGGQIRSRDEGRGGEGGGMKTHT
jgi:hypothetical protein